MEIHIINISILLTGAFLLIEKAIIPKNVVLHLGVVISRSEMLHTNLKIPHVVGTPGAVRSFFAHLSLLSPLCLASSYFWNLITARKIPTLIQGQTLLIKCLGPSFWERKCQSWAVNTWDGMAHITHIGTVVRLTAEQNTGHRPQLWAQNKNPSTITVLVVNCTKSHWYLSLHPKILLLLLWGITTT